VTRTRIYKQEVVQDEDEMEVDDDQSSDTYGVEEEASFDNITENERKSNLSSVVGNKYEEQVIGNKNEELEEGVQDQGKLEVDHDQSSDTNGVEDKASHDKITENERKSNPFLVVGNKNEEQQEVVQDKGEMELNYDQSSNTHGVDYQEGKEVESVFGCR
jgi:hypothetical protein